MARQDRPAGPLRRFFAGVVQSVLTVLVIVFTVGSLVGNAKSTLSCIGSCVGLSKTDRPKIQVRAEDENNPGDHRLRLALERICRAASLPTEKLRVAIVESDVVNAASFGDSRFILFAGLKRVPSSALNAVLAHEVAHDLHGHTTKTERAATIINVVVSLVGAFFGSDTSGTDQVATWTKDAALPSYSRGQELEADSAAVEILGKAAYGAGAGDVMRYTLEWLRRNQGEAGGGFLDSHPSIAERIARFDALHAVRPEPWEVFYGALDSIAKEPSVAAFLGAHADIELGQLITEGLSRLDDTQILERTALVAHMLDSSPEAICAGIVTRDYGAVSAALNLVGSASASRLAEFNRLAVSGKVQGKPEGAMRREDVAATLDGITNGMNADDSNRFMKALKAGDNNSMEELCWASRVLFRGIGHLRDTKAAAQLARRVARYP